MDEACLQLRLVDELIDGCPVLRQMAMDTLDDEVANEILGAVCDSKEDLGHAALANTFDEIVAAHLLARSGRGIRVHLPRGSQIFLVRFERKRRRVTHLPHRIGVCFA